MYPDAEDATFDMDYYINKHIAMVKEKCAPAIRECTVEQAWPDRAARYKVIAASALIRWTTSEVRGAERPIFAAESELHQHQAVIQINEVVI